jgi:hypothetical protein
VTAILDIVDENDELCVKKGVSGIYLKPYVRGKRDPKHGYDLTDWPEKWWEKPLTKFMYTPPSPPATIEVEEATTRPGGKRQKTSAAQTSSRQKSSQTAVVYDFKESAECVCWAARASGKQSGPWAFDKRGNAQSRFAAVLAYVETSFQNDPTLTRQVVVEQLRQRMLANVQADGEDE